ncbi:Vitamin K epoxide reductase [Turneriella parva DSM 21527]|uniref:Vitamin K epoxide reductase n=2 Tax=Turneriella TaxID=338321 RepID=I4B8H2_TURPD|nr:Vitamin K epoxide reductase [Turneriella parva DSM 21527]
MQLMFKKPLILPAALVITGALIGMLFSGILIYEHNGAKTQIGSAVCDVNQASSCEKAKDSAVGKIFGLPLALYGYAFYGTMAALALFLLLALNDIVLSLLFWGAISALLFDAFLLLYSLVVLQGICRLCAITYIATVILAVGAYLFNRDGAKMIKAETISISAKAVLGLVFAATIGSGLFFHTASLQAQSTPVAGATEQEQKLREQLNNEFYKQWKAGEIVKLDKPRSGSKGAANPVLTIMEFADPLCPHCKDMGVVLNEFVKKHGDKVRVIFRHYPLDIQCNDAMKRAFHVGACDLARAMECGEAQGKFWPMHDAIFSQQELFFRNPVSERAIESLAAGAGLNTAAMGACFKSQATMAKVKADIAAGNKIKITGTPTTIINDRRLPGVPLEFVPGILEKILLEESRR